MSVNVPTNQRIKEKDINSKLQLYGIYSAFSKGKVPSNRQIDVAMNTALEWKGLTSPSKKLSQDGQQLVHDLRDVIEKTKVLLLTKNSGNLIQDFVWQTENLDAGNAQAPGAPVDKATAEQHGNQALEGLRTLGELLITNGQFRKLLSDAAVLLRDIAGDAAGNLASQVKPSEDELNKLDDAAPDNTWHDKPDLSGQSIKKQINAHVPINKQDVKAAAQEGQDAAEQQHEQQGGTQTQEGAKKDASAGAAAAKQNIQSKIEANTPEEDKEKLRKYREKSREYFKGKMPKERREQVIWRLKKMLVEIQSQQDYHKAIDTLLRLAEQYTGYSQNIAGQGQGAVKGAHSGNSQLNSAEADLKTLLERFANGTSFDDLTDSINTMYKHADEDPELKNWFKHVNKFIRRCLKEEGYVLDDKVEREWDQIYDQGNFLLRDRYKDDTNHIVDELKFLAEQFEEDPQNKAFKDSMDKLFDHLGHDAAGNQEFKPHLVKDLTNVLLPAFFENIRYVPLPRIEFSDPMIDVVVENLVLEGDNLAPNQFEFGSDNYWRWGRKQFTSTNKNKVLLSVSGIQMDLRDVAYYVQKKEGFPGITDKGVMDVFLGGTGLSFKVAMETADKSDREHFFKINTITVDIKNLNIKIKQSNHKLLFNLFKPLLLKVMKPALLSIAEKQIRQSVRQADAFLYSVKKEADRAVEEAKNNPDPENIENIYQRYVRAFQAKLREGEKKKEEAKAKAADKEVNVAITQKDSLFKNISLPGGISSKATEYNDLAAKGDKWESPVFSIGSAQESKDLPSVTEPKRKPHSTRQMGLRDRAQGGADQQGSQGQSSQQGQSGLYDGQSQLPSGAESGANTAYLAYQNQQGLAPGSRI